MLLGFLFSDSVIPTGAARFFLPRRFVARRAAEWRDRGNQRSLKRASLRTLRFNRCARGLPRSGRGVQFLLPRPGPQFESGVCPSKTSTTQSPRNPRAISPNLRPPSPQPPPPPAPLPRSSHPATPPPPQPLSLPAIPLHSQPKSELSTPLHPLPKLRYPPPHTP